MKVVVATGVTAGCGLAAMQQLVARDDGPYRVIIGSRRELDSAETQASLKELIALRKSSQTIVEYLALDLVSLPSVEKFATQVKDRLGDAKVDNLLLCAGAICNERRSIALPNGNEVEETIFVNVLSQVYLTRLLLDTLAPAGNVTIVNSAMHMHGPSNATPSMLDDVLGPKKWGLLPAYNFSKLILMHFALILNRDRRFAAAGRRVVSLHPGFAPDTGLVRSTPWIVSWPMAHVLPYLPGMTSINSAGQTIVRAMTDPEFPSGTYLVKDKLAPYAAQCDNGALRKLWEDWLIEQGVWP